MPTHTIEREKIKGLNTIPNKEIKTWIDEEAQKSPEEYTSWDRALAWELFDRVADGRIKL